MTPPLMSPSPPQGQLVDIRDTHIGIHAQNIQLANRVQEVDTSQTAVKQVVGSFDEGVVVEGVMSGESRVLEGEIRQTSDDEGEFTDAHDFPMDKITYGNKECDMEGMNNQAAGLGDDKCSTPVQIPARDMISNNDLIDLSAVATSTAGDTSVHKTISMSTPASAVKLPGNVTVSPPGSCMDMNPEQSQTLQVGKEFSMIFDADVIKETEKEVLLCGERESGSGSGEEFSDTSEPAKVGQSSDA